MIQQNIRTYFKFLSRNKVYTFVSIFGFSVSLMFVILLSLYTKQELSVDNFHEKKDRIYLMTHEYQSAFANSVAPYVKDKCPEVEAFCRVHSRKVSVGEKGTEKQKAYCMFVDSSFFTMFSFKLLEGTPNQVLAAQRSVVITKSFAEKIFGSGNPLGKTLSIDNTQHTITGIMEEIPQNTQFPEVDFVVSHSSITQYWGDWILNVHNNFGFSLYFLEKEDSDLSAKIPFLLEEFKKDLWLYEMGFADKLEFVPLQDAYFDVIFGGYLEAKTNSKTLIKIYIAIVILILVIATLNYVNMTIAQSGFRGKEAAIKKLLGGSKKSIMLQLINESLLITTIAFAIGLFLTFVCEPYFDEMLTTKLQLAKQFTPSVIATFLIFILFVAGLSGIVPALVISNFNPLEVVKGSFAKKVKTTYSKGLIVFQYIIAITLLSSTFFIKQQSDFLINYELGYDHDGVFTMDISLDTTQTEGFKDKLLSIAGVSKVSYSCGTPMNRGNNNSFEKDGQQYSTQYIEADADFFDIYGIIVEPADAPFTEKSLFINKGLFNTPLADKANMIIELDKNERMPITALVDFHMGAANLHKEYSNFLIIKKINKSTIPWNVSVKLDSKADMLPIANKIQKAYTEYTGGEVADEAKFASNTIQQWYEREQKLSNILSAFTLLTIIISIMGVFAMSMYMIKQKEKEIGLRKVNGATEAQILLMLNSSSLLRVFVAFIIACPITYYAISKWLEDFSYRIALNWWTFALSGLIIALLTLLSVSYMTWRAAKANPVETLKSE